jgi:hypothetical protein
LSEHAGFLSAGIVAERWGLVKKCAAAKLK